MIIGIDISSVCYQTGVSNYTLNVVRHLLRNDSKNQYKLFFSSLRQPLPPEIKEFSNHSNVTLYHFRLPPTLLQIMWNQLRLLPIELFIGRCDIFHTSDWTQPPTLRAKTIATIHDLTPFLYPQWHHQKVIKAHKNKMKWASKKCAHFICVSQNTQKDLLKLFPSIRPEKTSIVYEAAENKYGQFIKLSTSIQQKKKEIIKKQYGLDNFVLAQGTREPRKNLDRLVQAFINFKNKYPKSTVELAISGKYGWGKDITNPPSFVKILGFIPEKDMVALHASAICLAYPSLYEGFGLPLVKSLKVGTPIITSDVSSMPEIVNKSAILVDPTSVTQITNALEKILHSQKLRQKLRQEGIVQSQKFTWTKTATQTLKVYNQVINLSKI